MHPILFRFKTPDFLKWLFPDEIQIYSYGVMIALGILLSFYVGLYKSKKFNLSSDKLSSLMIWIIVAAFVGGKLFYYLESPRKYFGDPSLMLDLSGGGFVFYGSLIFAVPTIVWWLRKEKIPVRPFIDIFAILGPIVHSFGRIGCFMAGCCHGTICNVPWGVTFKNEESLAEPLNVPLHPTQLYDILVNVIILAVVLMLEKKKQFDGQLFLIYLVMYAVGRSIVEMFRGDEERGYLFNGALSHSQFIAIVVIILSAVVWMRWSKTAKA